MKDAKAEGERLAELYVGHRVEGSLLALAFERAILAAREECALIAEDMDHDPDLSIAKAIRARGAS